MAHEEFIHHFLQKDGTFRGSREGLLNAANKFSLEERSLHDLISLIVDLSDHLLFYDPNNRPDGNWRAFLENDPGVILAHIISFDSQQLSIKFEKHIDYFRYKSFIGKARAEDWHRITKLYMDVLHRAEWWYRSFKIRDGYSNGHSHAFREDLYHLMQILQKILDRLAVLSHSAGNVIGRDTRLDIAGLNYFDFSGPTDYPEEETHSIEEIVLELRRVHNSITNNLSHLKNKACEYFEEILGTGNHQPQTGLLIAFLKLYRKSAGSFDNITNRHRDYFFREMLKLSESPPQKDKAIVTFSLTDGYNSVYVPSGTLFEAGKDTGGREIVYELTDETYLNQAFVNRIQNLFVGMNEMYGPALETDEKFITGMYKADLTADNFSGKEMPLFGKDQTGLMEQNRSMDDAFTGFALAGSPFYLSEGTRHIKIRLIFESDGYRKFLQKTADIAQHRENETQRSLLAKIFSDAFLIDYTTSGSWFSKKRFAVQLPPHGEENDNPYLDFSIVLDDEDLPVTGYRKEVHGGNYDSDSPVMRFTLNPNAHLFAYSILNELSLVSVITDIDVKGLQNLTVYNDAGLTNTDEPFFPFGPVPVKGSRMVIGHNEAFYKSLDSIRLQLDWDQLPDQPRGMYDYYHEYPGEINNTSFLISVSVLSGKWEQLEKEPRYLFATEKIPEKDEPEPAGRLSKTTLLDDISLTNTGMGDHPEKIGQKPVYTTRSDYGFVKIELAGPQMAFGHKLYPQLLSNIFLQNANLKKGKELLPMPMEPHTPVLRAITLDYTHKVQKEIRQNISQGGFDLYHIHPLEGEKKVNTKYENQTIPLLPQMPHQGYLILQLKKVEPLQAVSLFFQLRENISNQQYEAPPEITWEYFANHQWKPFPGTSVIRDTTNGFMNTGIVVLNLPETLRYDPLWKEKSGLSIRACAVQNAEVVSRLVGVSTQAGIVERVPFDEDDSLHPIEAGTISGLKTNIPGIDSIEQPLPSYGGRPAEDTDEFYIRTQERLKHRNMAVTVEDYERIVLEEFRDVRKANCLPGISSERPKSDPGNAIVAVIPDSRKYPDTSVQYPRFSAGKLFKIRRYLLNKTTPFARIEVRNPLYERIIVRCSVAFREEGGGGHLLKKLNRELTSYISPWIDDSEADIVFGEALNLTDLNGFIHSRPYIQYVTGLSVLKISEINNNLYDLADTSRYTGHSSRLTPARPWSVMVSDCNHEIEILESRKRKGPEHAGIGNLGLGDDFIIT